MSTDRAMIESVGTLVSWVAIWAAIWVLQPPFWVILVAAFFFGIMIRNTLHKLSTPNCPLYVKRTVGKLDTRTEACHGTFHFTKGGLLICTGKAPCDCQNDGAGYRPPCPACAVKIDAALAEYLGR